MGRGRWRTRMSTLASAWRIGDGFAGCDGLDSGHQWRGKGANPGGEAGRDQVRRCRRENGELTRASAWRSGEGIAGSDGAVTAINGGPEQALARNQRGRRGARGEGRLRLTGGAHLSAREEGEV